VLRLESFKGHFFGLPFAAPCTRQVQGPQQQQMQLKSLRTAEKHRRATVSTQKAQAKVRKNIALQLSVISGLWLCPICFLDTGKRACLDACADALPWGLQVFGHNGPNAHCRFGKTDKIHASSATLKQSSPHGNALRLRAPFNFIKVRLHGPGPC